MDKDTFDRLVRGRAILNAVTEAFNAQIKEASAGREHNQGCPLGVIQLMTGPDGCFEDPCWCGAAASMMPEVATDASSLAAFLSGSQFPSGKLNENDKGQLALAIGTEGNAVVIDFGGKHVNWIGFGYDEAKALAKAIAEKAESIKARPTLRLCERCGDELALPGNVLCEYCNHKAEKARDE